MTPEEFVSKWKRAELKERSAAQEHWIDVCRMLGQKTPAEADPVGDFYCFERGAGKSGGGEGWADVWFKGHFAIEYKGKRKNLTPQPIKGLRTSYKHGKVVVARGIVEQQWERPNERRCRGSQTTNRGNKGKPTIRAPVRDRPSRFLSARHYRVKPEDQPGRSSNHRAGGA